MLDRDSILKLSLEELDGFDPQTSSLSDQAVMLIGFQRTKQISRRSRKSWEAGNSEPMAQEVRERRSEIIQGAFSEIWQEFVPVRNYFSGIGFHPAHIADIGCGAAINDIFLAREYEPRFTLIDIEQTDEQYHGWASSGAGYASLASAKSLLEENGVDGDRILLVNPRNDPKSVDPVSPDLAISLYSCGFHYPIDEYLSLFLRTINRGGVVVLDVRGRYLRQKSPALEELFSSGSVTEIYQDVRSVRIAIGP